MIKIDQIFEEYNIKQIYYNKFLRSRSEFQTDLYINKKGCSRTRVLQLQEAVGVVPVVCRTVVHISVRSNELIKRRFTVSQRYM